MPDYSHASREDLLERISALEAVVADQAKILGAIAAMDDLTKLATRQTVLARLCQEIARADRYGIPCSVLLLDVDHLKDVNERHGHLAGDEVLVEVATMIGREIRVMDFAGRQGGEEFLVVLPVTTAAQAAVVGERLRTTAENLVLPGGLSITVSVGVVEYSKGTVEDLLDSVGRCLAAAKARGGNRVEPGTR